MKLAYATNKYQSKDRTKRYIPRSAEKNLKVVIHKISAC